MMNFDILQGYKNNVYAIVMCGSVSNPGGFQLQSSTFHPNLCRHCSELTSNPGQKHQTSSPERSSAGPVLNAPAIMYFFFPQANRAKALCLCLIHVIKVSPANYTHIAQAALQRCIFRCSHRSHETSYKRYIWVCDISLSTKQITFLST